MLVTPKIIMKFQFCLIKYFAIEYIVGLLTETVECHLMHLRTSILIHLIVDIPTHLFSLSIALKFFHLINSIQLYEPLVITNSVNQ